MYCLPQEIEVWYIIPALRKEIAGILVKKHKLSFEKAGEILGISKAAVSQYLSNKRATKIKLNEEIKKKVEIAAKKMLKDKRSAVFEIENLLKEMKKNKEYCEICKKYNKEVINFCDCNRVC
jgi:predicted transcriptional regulator